MIERKGYPFPLRTATEKNTNGCVGERKNANG